MILHLKEDSKLVDLGTSRVFMWAAGQHSVEDGLAKRLLEKYPNLFEEVAAQEGVTLAPSADHTTAPTQPVANTFQCDFCGKEFQTALALVGHKRTHNKVISTDSLLPHH